MFPDTGRDHLGVDILDLWDSLAHQWGDIFKSLITVDWVSNESNVLDFWQLRKLGNLIPRLDPVVCDEESVQFNAWVKTLQLLNLVVGNPELLQGLTDLIKSYNSLDVVSTKGKDLQTFQLWQVDNSLDCV